MVTTPDGRQVFLPDSLMPPGVPPPVSDELAGGPSVPPPVPAPASPAPPPVPVQAPAPIAPIGPVPTAPVPPAQTPAGKPGKAAPPPTPEQQIEQATQAQAGEKQEQARTATQIGDLEAQQLAETNAAKQKAYTKAWGLQQHGDLSQEAYRQKIADASKQAEGAVNAYANFKVDPGRQWANMSTGRKILAGISVALSGLGDAFMRKTGPNAALGIIQGAIKDDVDQQWKQKESLGQEIGFKNTHLASLRSAAADDREAMNYQIAGEYKKAADQIDLAASKYASPIAKARAQQTSSQLRADADGIIGTAAEQRVARQHAAEQIQISKGQLGLGYAHLAEQKAEFKETQDFAKQKWSEEQLLEYSKLLQAGEKEKAAQLKAQQDQIMERGIMAPEVVKAPDGTVQTHYEPLVQEDGKTPFTIAKERAKDVQEVGTGVLKGIHAIDALRQIRSESGGQAFNTVEARQLAAEEARAIIALHEAGGIKRFSGDVIDLMKKKLDGGEDVTSIIHSIMPNLEDARRDLTDDWNDTLRGANYTGKKRVEFLDPLAQGKPAESAAKQRNRVLESNVQQTPLFSGSIGSLPHELMGEPGQRLAAANQVDITPDQKDVLDTQSSLLRNPATAQNAREVLWSVYSNPKTNGNVKAYAAKILEADRLRLRGQ